MTDMEKILSVHWLYKNKHLDVCKHSDIGLDFFSPIFILILRS